jgi:hypothetical protein
VTPGNVALYAKVMTLVINSALWTDLDDAQRAIITTASDATRAWAIANQETDAAAAAAFCAGGGTVVLADAPGIAAFRAAERPVYAALEADPTTKRAIDAIRAQTTGGLATPVKACQPVITSANITPVPGDLPNGIYRVVFSDDYLTANGVQDLLEEHGIWTFKLENGYWTLDVVADNPQRTPHLAGVYHVDGKELFWTIDTDPSNTVGHFIWSSDDRGDLSFAPAPGADRDWWFGLPWERVGALK